MILRYCKVRSSRIDSREGWQKIHSSHSPRYLFQISPQTFTSVLLISRDWGLDKLLFLPGFRCKHLIFLTFLRRKTRKEQMVWPKIETVACKNKVFNRWSDGKKCLAQWGLLKSSVFLPVCLGCFLLIFSPLSYSRCSLYKLKALQ